MLVNVNLLFYLHTLHPVMLRYNIMMYFIITTLQYYDVRILHLINNN